MKFTRFTPEYLAGLVTGFGLALFVVFMIASSGALDMPAAYKFTFGLAGLVLWPTGAIWKLRIQNRQQD